MKSTTRKLSGPALEHLLRRVIIEEGVDSDLALRLAQRLGRVLSSVRARRVPLRNINRVRTITLDAPVVPATPAEEAAVDTPPTAPVSPAAAAFDPYAFGLVPVFQREGATGLAARLAAISQADDLRAMARAQQIALDPRLKSGNVDLETLRQAVVAAVEKRIADRKAAAR